MNNDFITEIRNYLELLSSDNINIFTDENSEHDGLDFSIFGMDFLPETLRITRMEVVEANDEIVSFDVDVSVLAHLLLEADDYREAIHDKEDDEWYNVQNVSIEEDYELTLENLSIDLNIENETFAINTNSNSISIDVNADDFKGNE